MTLTHALESVKFVVDRDLKHHRHGNMLNTISVPQMIKALTCEVEELRVASDQEERVDISELADVMIISLHLLLKTGLGERSLVETIHYKLFQRFEFSPDDQVCLLKRLLPVDEKGSTA